MVIIDGLSKDYQNLKEFKNDLFSSGSLIAFSTRKFILVDLGGSGYKHNRNRNITLCIKNTNVLNLQMTTRLKFGIT